MLPFSPLARSSKVTSVARSPEAEQPVADSGSVSEAKTSSRACLTTWQVNSGWVAGFIRLSQVNEIIYGDGIAVGGAGSGLSNQRQHSCPLAHHRLNSTPLHSAFCEQALIREHGNAKHHKIISWYFDSFNPCAAMLNLNALLWRLGCVRAPKEQLYSPDWVSRSRWDVIIFHVKVYFSV